MMTYAMVLKVQQIPLMLVICDGHWDLFCLVTRLLVDRLWDVFNMTSQLPRLLILVK